MALFFHIVLMTILGFVFYQDWKFRAVTWFVFPVLALAALLIFLLPGAQWEMLGLNLVFVTVVIMALFAYISLRERRWTNIFSDHLGIGDVLFLYVIAPLFNNLNFIFFFITGMLLAGFFHLAVQKRLAEPTIPLAGYLAVYVLVLEGVYFLVPFDLFHAMIL